MVSLQVTRLSSAWPLKIDHPVGFREAIVRGHDGGKEFRAVSDKRPDGSQRSFGLKLRVATHVEMGELLQVTSVSIHQHKSGWESCSAAGSVADCRSCWFGVAGVAWAVGDLAKAGVSWVACEPGTGVLDSGDLLLTRKLGLSLFEKSCVESGIPKSGTPDCFGPEFCDTLGCSI